MKKTGSWQTCGSLFCRFPAEVDPTFPLDEILLGEKRLPDMHVRKISLALVRRWFQEQPRWLAQFDTVAREWRVPEAECLDGESYRETLERELAWQLNLQRNRHYIISSVPRLHLEFPVVRRTCSGETDVTVHMVEFYLVELFGSAGKELLDEDPTVQWWVPSQFLEGTVPAGTSASEAEFSAHQRELLRAADVFSDCHP